MTKNFCFWDSHGMCFAKIHISWPLHAKSSPRGRDHRVLPSRKIIWRTDLEILISSLLLYFNWCWSQNYLPNIKKRIFLFVKNFSIYEDLFVLTRNLLLPEHFQCVLAHTTDWAKIWQCAFEIYYKNSPIIHSSP